MYARIAIMVAKNYNNNNNNVVLYNLVMKE